MAQGPPEQVTRNKRTIEAWYRLARGLARRRARRPDDCEDLVQEGMIALHKEAPEEQDDIRDQWAFARTVVDRAMRNYYSHGRWEKKTPTCELIVERATHATRSSGGDDGGAEALEDALVLEAYLRDLTETCGEEHGWIAENLVTPTNELGVWVLREIAEKREKQAAKPGSIFRHVNEINVCHRTVRDALGWDWRQWDEVIGTIRAFTRDWMTEHGMEPPA